MLKHCSKQMHITIITMIITSYMVMKCRLLSKNKHINMSKKGK